MWCGWGFHRWRTVRLWSSHVPEVPGHGPSRYFHREDECRRCGLSQQKGSGSPFKRVKM